MPIPSDMTTVTVYGQYVDVDGTPATGEVVFTAVTRLRSAATLIAVLPSSITAPLDTNGRFTTQIPATDDPDITPAGWAWSVEERFDLDVSGNPTYRRSYLMLAPISGGSIDLTGVQPAEPPTPAPVNSIATVVGKGADADGNIKIYLRDLSDTTVTAATAGQVLEYDGTNWVASAAPAGSGDLRAVNNLSDVADVPTARTNLGLHGAALLDVGTAAGTVAAGNDSRVVGAAQKAANLSDLASASTARASLGLGGAALLNVGGVTGTVAAGDDARVTGAAQKAANLSDLASVTTARTNLGLGAAALLNVGTAASTVAAGNDSRITGAAPVKYLPVANGTHFNGNGGATSSSLVQTRCRQTRKLLRVIAGGADKLQVEWANIWTTTVPQVNNASCEIAGPNAVTVRMAIEYPAGSPRLVSGSTAYSSSTAYALLDQVTSGGASWVCIQAGTGQTPATGSAYWRQVNRYVVNWSGQTDSSGTVVFNPGDYKQSLPASLSEKTRTGDCIAVLGAFDSGGSTGYLPYAGMSGACNTAPFVDWVVDSASGLPAVGSSLVDTGITNQTNGNTTPSGGTDSAAWMKIPFATAITGNIPTTRCVALFGDSIIQGYGGDIRDGEPCGIFPRSIDGTSWWRIAQGGNKAGCYVPGNAPWQMSVVARCSAVLADLCINDMQGGLTTAQVQAAMKTLWLMLDSTGAAVYAGYPTPISASSDGWVTTTNQTRFLGAGGTIPTTQFATDADYSSTVYGQVSTWMSQDGASITTPDGATTRVGQVNHPLTGLVDYRQLLADPATSWRWTPSYTTDGAHPTPVAAMVQSIYLAPQMEPLILARQQLSAPQPGWSSPGFPPVLSFDRSLVRDLSSGVSTGSILGVLGMSPGRYFYGFRMFAGSAAGSRTWSLLTGADLAKMKVLASGTFTTTANTIQDTGLPGAPVWIPGGQTIAVVVTSPAANSWLGLVSGTAGSHRSGPNFVVGGTSTDTAAITGTVSLYQATKFTAGTFRPHAEIY